MFHVHSKLSKKILKKFLTIYTIIFVFLFLIVFAGGGTFFLYNAKKNIEAKITTITNIWDEFETTKREQIYSLLINLPDICKNIIEILLFRLMKE